MLRNWWRALWGQPEPDPALLLLGQMTQNHKEQMALLQSQLDLVGKWMAMFTQPAAIVTDPDAIEHELRANIELSARMGNDDALDLLKDESALESYIRIARQSQ